MTNLLLKIAIFSLFSHVLLGQVTFQKTIGGTDDDRAFSLTFTPDGGYVVCGLTNSFGSPNLDVLLHKFNVCGEVEWSKTYPSETIDEPGFKASAIVLDDEGFLIITNTLLGGSTSVLLIKTDPMGEVLWSHIYGGSDQDLSHNTLILPTNEILVSVSSRSFGGVLRDIQLLKLSATGTILWAKNYDNGNNDNPMTMYYMPDGTFTIIGLTYGAGAGAHDGYLMRVGENGEFLWGKAYGGSSTDYFRHGIPTNDGGFIMVGRTESFGGSVPDGLIVKVDELGNLEWAKKYIGSALEDVITVRQATDGNYYLVGYTDSFGNGGFDLFLMKINTLGEQLWAKTYGGSEDDKFFPYSDSFSIQEADNILSIVGSTASFGAGNNDFLLIQTDMEGNIEGENCFVTDFEFTVAAAPVIVTNTNPSITTNSNSSPVTLISQNVEVITENICISSNTSTLLDLGSDIILCENEPQMLDAGTGFDTYLWQDGSTAQTFTASQAGIYHVTASSNCAQVTDTIEITYSTLPTIDLGDDRSICEGEVAILDADNEWENIVWQDGSTAPFFATNMAGVYWAVANNSCGTITDSITISFHETVPQANLGNDTTLCEGESLVLDATFSGNATYLWQDGSSAPTFTPQTTGNYLVQVSNICGVAIDSINIVFESTIAALDLGNDTTLCEGESLLLTPNLSENAVYLWQNGDMQPSFTLSATGNYWLMATNSCGSVSDTIAVFFNDCDTLTMPEPEPIPEPEATCQLLFPTAFSPNDDGINDFFRPHSQHCTFNTFQLQIYNRWGEKVFESKDISDAWDGLYGRKNCPVGVYVWSLQYEISDETVVQKGNLTLMR